MPSMQQSRSLAVMFLLGTFLAGGALGFVADRAVNKHPYQRQFDGNGMREAFATELHLSPEQQRSIDSVWAWRTARERAVRKLYKPAVDSIFALHRPALDSILDSSRVLINARLDTTQQRLFRELRDSMRSQDSIKKAESRKGSREGKQR